MVLSFVVGFDVVVTAFPGKSPARAASVLEDLLGLEPASARALVGSIPCAVIRGTTQAHAEIASEQLREAGATVEIVDRAPPQPAPASPPGLGARQLFDTVALRGLEHDLSHLDPHALPSAETSRREEPPQAPSWDTPLEDSPLRTGSDARRQSRTELPDVDALLGPAATGRLAAARPSAELEDLFRIPVRQGAAPLPTRREGDAGPSSTGKARALAPAGATAGRGAGPGAARAPRDEAPGPAPRRSLASKVGFAVGALGLLALALVLARLESRASDAAANAPGLTRGASRAELAAWQHDKELGRLHPAIRWVPDAVAPSVAKAMRKRVELVFHAPFESKIVPADLDCMFVTKKDGRSAERISQLMRTGMRVAPPPELDEPLQKQLGLLRESRNDPEEEFELLCLSILAIDALVADSGS